MKNKILLSLNSWYICAQSLHDNYSILLYRLSSMLVLHFRVLCAWISLGVLANTLFSNLFCWTTMYCKPEWA